VTIGTGLITGFSVSHEHATLDDIDAASAESQRTGVEHLLSGPGVEEAYVLQTCNRTEAYVVTDDRAAGTEALSTFTDLDDDTVRTLGHEESLRHLMRVAAGLESFVLGEDQIIGQVRDAYEDARGVAGIGPLLEEGITKAIHVGERARTETAINDGVVSLASAAVKLASEEHGIEGETALVVGAGEMGQLAVNALEASISHLYVANRTIPHAEHLVSVADVDGTAMGLDADDLAAAVEDASVVISATDSPDPIFETGTFAGVDETFVVDIAHPRDVPQSAETHETITHYDLDDLEAVTEKTRRTRREAAERVEAMVDSEFEHLLTRYKRKRADSVISAMYESAEEVKTTEVETALSKLDGLDDDQQEVVESMADAIVSNMLAAPTKSLRDAAEDDDWATINTALRLFDPDFGPETAAVEPPEFVDTGGVGDVPESVRATVREQLDD